MIEFKPRGAFIQFFFAQVAVLGFFAFISGGLIYGALRIWADMGEWGDVIAITILIAFGIATAFAVISEAVSAYRNWDVKWLNEQLHAGHITHNEFREKLDQFHIGDE